jgi:hypothetical protein
MDPGAVRVAIFAVRNLLRELLAEQRRANELLEHIGGYRAFPSRNPKPTVWRAPLTSRMLRRWLQAVE